MGAWGCNVLDNDTASDVLGDITDPKKEAPVPHILKTIDEYSKSKEFSEYADSDESDEILVCVLLILGFTDINTIEKRKGESISEYFVEKIAKFITENRGEFDKLIKNDHYKKAEKLFPIILDKDKSEAYALWAEASDEDFKAWKGEVEGILEDLKTVSEK